MKSGVCMTQYSNLNDEPKYIINVQRENTARKTDTQQTEGTENVFSY